MGYNVCMKTLLKVDSIVLEQSPFNYRPFLFLNDEEKDTIEQSFSFLGILMPLLVYADRNGQYHLIDGERRLCFARKKGLKEIKARILPPETPVEALLDYLLYQLRDEVQRSAMNGIGFIHFAVKTGISVDWIFQSLSRLPGFRPDRRFIGEVEKIMDLPLPFRRFCHEKRYSLKQVRNLAALPMEIIHLLMEWEDDLHLTASVLDEIGSGLRDCIRREKVDLEEFVKTSGFEDVITSGLSPREKTEEIRRILRERRYPVLSEANRRIEERFERINLPEGVSVRWDRTLENREVKVELSMRSADEWERISGLLRAEALKRAIEETLEEI